MRSFLVGEAGTGREGSRERKAQYRISKHMCSLYTFCCSCYCLSPLCFSLSLLPPCHPNNRPARRSGILGLAGQRGAKRSKTSKAIPITHANSLLCFQPINPTVKTMADHNINEKGANGVAPASEQVNATGVLPPSTAPGAPGVPATEQEPTTATGEKVPQAVTEKKANRFDAADVSLFIRLLSCTHCGLAS
jgi:hypothetical protein